MKRGGFALSRHLAAMGIMHDGNPPSTGRSALSSQPKGSLRPVR